MHNSRDREVTSGRFNRRRMLGLSVAALSAASMLLSATASFAQSVDLSQWSPEYIKSIAGTAEVDTAGHCATVVPLDIDAPGAQIHQPKLAVGTGQELAQVDDDKAGKRELGVVAHGAHFSVLPAKCPGSLYFTVCRCSQ